MGSLVTPSRSYHSSCARRDHEAVSSFVVMSPTCSLTLQPVSPGLSRHELTHSLWASAATSCRRPTHGLVSRNERWEEADFVFLRLPRACLCRNANRRHRALRDTIVLWMCRAASCGTESGFAGTCLPRDATCRRESIGDQPLPLRRERMRPSRSSYVFPDRRILARLRARTQPGPPNRAEPGPHCTSPRSERVQ